MSVYTNQTGQAGIGYGTRHNRWQDWINLLLGIWLFITPWIWGPGLTRSVASTQNPAYTTTTSAYQKQPYTTPGAAAASPAPVTYGPAISSEWNAWIVGVIIFLVSLWAMFAISAATGVEWINVIAGIYLFLSPWILSFASGGAAAWNAWVMGIIVFFVALSAVPQMQTRRHSGPPAPTGS